MPFDRDHVRADRRGVPGKKTHVACSLEEEDVEGASLVISITGDWCASLRVDGRLSRKKSTTSRRAQATVDCWLQGPEVKSTTRRCLTPDKTF
eukprot:1191787-Prorocentrum_minimum.AAC.2